jgi:hypothetical protein
MSKRGPKPTYDKERHPRMARWIYRAGGIDKDVAEEFRISVRQLYRWLKDYPELRQAKEECAVVDFMVEDSLLKRALGFEYKEIAVEKEGVGDQAAITKTKVTTKQVAPDVSAQRLWLINRQPKRWRDKVEMEHGVGKDLLDVLEKAWEKRGMNVDTAQTGQPGSAPDDPGK